MCVWVLSLCQISLCVNVLTSGTSHLFHLFGVAVKLNKSHMLCCAHLWHCSLICLVLTISLICLNCKDLWPICILYYCAFSEFHMLDLLLHFSPAFSLQWCFCCCCCCCVLCLICLCAVILCLYCVASCFWLFQTFSNMIIVSLVLNLSHLL